MIITVANQKGGVGKTITAVNLSAALGASKRSTLLVDMDPQGHSTLSFVDMLPEHTSVYSILRGEFDVRDAVMSVKEEGIDLLPTNISLAKMERDLISEIDGQFRLKDILSPIRSDYEFIIVDTPPALGMLTINCLVAADTVLIPVQSSYLSLEGTEDLLDTIAKIKSRLNQKLNILGALITIHDSRTILGKDAIERVRRIFGDRVFRTIISRSVRLEESPAYKESILRYAPNSESAREFIELCEEVVERVSAARTS